MSTTHECPVPGCTKRVPRHMLMCRAHWSMVPKVIRDEIWDAYRSGDGARHSRAIRAAIQAVNETINRAALADSGKPLNKE